MKSKIDFSIIRVYYTFLLSDQAIIPKLILTIISDYYERPNVGYRGLMLPQSFDQYLTNIHKKLKRYNEF